MSGSFDYMMAYQTGNIKFRALYKNYTEKSTGPGATQALFYAIMRSTFRKIKGEGLCTRFQRK